MTVRSGREQVFDRIIVVLSLFSRDIVRPAAPRSRQGVMGFRASGLHARCGNPATLEPCPAAVTDASIETDRVGQRQDPRDRPGVLVETTDAGGRYPGDATADSRLGLYDRPSFIARTEGILRSVSVVTRSRPLLLLRTRPEPAS